MYRTNIAEMVSVCATRKIPRKLLGGVQYKSIISTKKNLLITELTHETSEKTQFSGISFKVLLYNDD